MARLICIAFAALNALTQASITHAAAVLTETEQRWLGGATPVISWALHQGLPVDIVVSPHSDEGDAPLAMAYVDNRCKLIFAMRGNSLAESTLDSIPTAIFEATIEAMAAHEIAHCWRHRSGAFASLPSGLNDTPDEIESRLPTAELQAMAHHMRMTRREEAFADLVGLAWTQHEHPADYSSVLAWFERARSEEMHHSFHDTQQWLKLARAPQAFTSSESLFEQALSVWQHESARDLWRLQPLRRWGHEQVEQVLT